MLDRNEDDEELNQKMDILSFLKLNDEENKQNDEELVFDKIYTFYSLLNKVFLKRQRAQFF